MEHTRTRVTILNYPGRETMDTYDNEFYDTFSSSYEHDYYQPGAIKSPKNKSKHSKNCCCNNTHWCFKCCCCIVAFILLFIIAVLVSIIVLGNKDLTAASIPNATLRVLVPLKTLARAIDFNKFVVKLRFEESFARICDVPQKALNTTFYDAKRRTQRNIRSVQNNNTVYSETQFCISQNNTNIFDRLYSNDTKQLITNYSNTVSVYGLGEIEIYSEYGVTCYAKVSGEDMLIKTLIQQKWVKNKIKDVISKINVEDFDLQFHDLYFEDSNSYIGWSVMVQSYRDVNDTVCEMYEQVQNNVHNIPKRVTDTMTIKSNTIECCWTPGGQFNVPFTISRVCAGSQKDRKYIKCD